MYEMDLNQVTLVCLDYDASVEFYKKLGLTQIVDSPPRYARFETPSGSTLSIHNGERDDIASGTVVYFEVDDVDGVVQALQANGIEFATQRAGHVRSRKQASASNADNDLDLVRRHLLRQAGR